jgi:pyridoxamine 5'-phosphate oxidase
MQSNTPAMKHHTELLPEPLPPEPFALIERWMSDAWQQKNPPPNPNAMVLATSDAEGRISARVVLCKKIMAEPGYLVFYTNYLSRKGQQMAQNPRAAAVIYWDSLHRQVRVEGPIVSAPATDSDAYFASRPWPSRLGAWASEQSEPIDSRAALKQALAATAARFSVPVPADEDAANGLDIPIPRPPHWGGYRLFAEVVELWVEGEARLHDRARWSRALAPQAEGSFEPGPWSATRLQP